VICDSDEVVSLQAAEIGSRVIEKLGTIVFGIGGSATPVMAEWGVYMQSYRPEPAHPASELLQFFEKCHDNLQT